MNDKSGVLLAGLRIILRNKRYIVWFYLLNLALAVMGALALQRAMSGILDTSLYSQRLLHGFDVFVFLDLTTRPEFAGHAVARPHLYFTFVFLFLSILFTPGVLDAYSSDRRLSREDFWATCGRNVWRFVRLFLIGGIITGVLFAVLMGVNGALGKAADNSSNEKLPFYVELAGAIVIFLIMTWIRIWFDLAQADVVIRDEGRVRKSIRSAAGYAAANLGRLLGAYVIITVVAVLVLLGGVCLWNGIIPPAAVADAFLVGQVTLFLFLVARFWQRGCAVAFCVTRMREAMPEDQVPTAIPATEPPPGMPSPDALPS
jgi:hypothetical protein